MLVSASDIEFDWPNEFVHEVLYQHNQALNDLNGS